MEDLHESYGLNVFDPRFDFLKTPEDTHMST